MVFETYRLIFEFESPRLAEETPYSHFRTTEAVIVERKEANPPAPAMPPGGMGDMY